LATSASVNEESAGAVFVCRLGAAELVFLAFTALEY